VQRFRYFLASQSLETEPFEKCLGSRRQEIDVDRTACVRLVESAAREKGAETSASCGACYHDGAKQGMRPVELEAGCPQNPLPIHGEEK
jgi:hypothetical protein